jgi:preprotein translocase subunit SecE
MPEKSVRRVGKPNAIQQYWRETVGELRKVSWPTPKEALNLTKIVLIVLLAMAAFLGLLDYGFTQLIGHFFA